MKNIPTAQELPGFDQTERGRVALLRRRRDHLERLLDNDKRSDHNWLAAEAAALTWALRIVEGHGKENVE